MSRNTKLFRMGSLGLCGLLLLCFAMLLSSCGEKAEDSADASEAKSEEFAISVKVAEVVRTSIKSTIHAVGAVEAVNQAKISAKIPGKVETILAEEGDKVEAGQSLIQLEKTDLELTMRQAEAAVSVAEANFAQARLEWERAQELFEQGISAQQHFDYAKSSFEVAEASVKQAQADLGLAQHQLDNAEVTTLFGGTITYKYIDIGERVSPGQPLFEVADMDPVEIEIGVSDRRFSELQIGQSVIITVDGYPDREFLGTVKKIQPAIDPMTRTFKVTVGVDNPDEQLKPGMFARAAIEIGYRNDTLVIPKRAMLEEEGKYYVVVVRDDRAVRAEIELGFRDGEQVEVISGLQEREQIVLEGAYALAQGALVQVSGE